MIKILGIKRLPMIKMFIIEVSNEKEYYNY